MNTLDIIVVAIVAISGLFAFVRGFTREALSIAAWGGAVAVAIYGAPMVQPIMRGFFSSAWLWLADILTYLAPFIVAVLLFSIFVGIASAQIRLIGLGALDRAFGLMFGVARGVLLVCLAYLLLSHLLQPENTPPWILEARSRPLLAAGAAQIQQLIPRAVIERNLPGAIPAANHAADKAGDALKASDALQQLNDAVDKLTAQPQPKPAQKPTDPNNPEANSDSKGLDQLFQAQGGK